MPTASLQQKTQKTPRIRFGGFSGVWEEKKLGEVFTEIKSGKDKPRVSGEYPVFGSTGNIGNTDNYSFQGKYILVARVGANAGRVNRVNGKFGVTDNTLVLDGAADANIDFFYNLLWSKKLNKLVFGSGQPLVTGGQLKKLKITIPSVKEEQQKIAGFLGAVDAWIENLLVQKVSLESYKKGMMQKIFAHSCHSRGSHPSPSGSSPLAGELGNPEDSYIRFKDDRGKNFPNWEEKKLGEVGDIITGTTPPTANKEYYGGNFPWVTPTDIDNEENIYTSTKLLTQKGIEKGRFVPKNSLLVTCIASIGKNAILRVDGSCNQQINAVLPDKNHNVDFLYYLLEKNKNTLIRFAGAGGMQMLNKKDFSGIRFEIPSLPEQQKIANFLTSLDKVIESKQHKIAKAEEWKKGLMQGLFV